MKGSSAWGTKPGAALQEIADRLDIDMTVAGYGSVFVPYFMSGADRRATQDLLRNNSEADVMFRYGNGQTRHLHVADGDETQSHFRGP